ncbi:MAG: HPr family phosphocarrier protein [Clostridiales bacterium]|nr:HPr family phosphocarrier protein [Clostridiales bacterium]
MREFEFTVTETSGIHARQAGHIAACMKQFKAEITIEKSGKKANAKKISRLWVCISK